MNLYPRYNKRDVQMADVGIVVMIRRGVVAGAVINDKTDHIRCVGPVGLDEGKAVGVGKGGEKQVEHQNDYGDSLCVHT